MPVLCAAEKPAFSAHYNRTCFAFQHRLHEDPIFDLDRLVELAKRLPDSYWSTQASAVDAGWDAARTPRRSLPETVRTMAESNSLVLLKGVEDDPEFGPLYRGVIEELHAHVGDALRTDVAIGRATLILSSPQRITPYHIDGEVNFLLQLRGEKTVNIFDPRDPTVLSDAELEAFYSGNYDAATYKPDRQSAARVFDFQPGHGLHLPLHAPHWTANRDSVSVALSINCSLRSMSRTAAVYRVNHLLRRRGQTPVPPGISPWRDRVKFALARGIDYARRFRPAIARAGGA